VGETAVRWRRGAPEWAMRPVGSDPVTEESSH